MLIRETGPDGWLRVSIGTAEEMTTFRQALTEVLEERSESMSQDRTHRAADQRVEGPRRARPRRHRPPRRLAPASASTTTCSTAFARHSLVDLTVQTAGDPTSTPTTPSRTPRSCSARRCARRSATRSGIRRFGDATVPLDEALVQAVVDVSGRPYCVHTGEPEGQAYVDHRRPSYLGLADPPRLRDPRVPRPPRPARAGAGGPRPAPPRRGAVQGVRPGVPRRGRDRPARDRRALHQGHALSR